VVSESDVQRLGTLGCIKSALGRMCDVKGSSRSFVASHSYSHYNLAEITPEIVVYRYSTPKLVEYLRVKVARLVASGALETSKMVIRSLAKDGLMDDGKEDLLQRAFAFPRKQSCIYCLEQLVAFEPPATWSLITSPPISTHSCWRPTSPYPCHLACFVEI
jgi:hypothetical protein